MPSKKPVKPSSVASFAHAHESFFVLVCFLLLASTVLLSLVYVRAQTQAMRVELQQTRAMIVELQRASHTHAE